MDEDLPPPSTTEQLKVLEQRVVTLEADLARTKQIGTDTWTCHVKAMAGAALDLGTTWAGQKYGTLNQQNVVISEGNPVVNAAGPTAVKIGLLAATDLSCFTVAKSGHDKAQSLISWSSLLIQLGDSVWNMAVALRGKPTTTPLAPAAARGRRR
jgi:hypothetical protein